MSIPQLSIAIGKQRVGESPRWPNEPGYIESIQRQTNAIVAKLRIIFKEFEKVSPEIMVEALRPTFELTQIEVPVDTGDLKKSGYLQLGSLRGKPRVEMGYGYHNSPPYAQLVHERTDIRHQSPTKAKYLQDPVMADLNNVYSRLGAYYKQFFNT